MTRRTAFALAGLAGSNAHGSGFLAAAQQLARERGVGSGLLPGLEMISCTSGAIASTAEYLRGADLRADLQRRIDDAEQARRRWWLATRETPQQAAAATVLFGVPGVFRGLLYALPRHYWRTALDFLREGIGWRRAPTVEDLTDLLLPARVLVPDLSEDFLAATVQTLTEAPVGVVFNSYAPTRDVEYLHVNDRGLALIREYHDPAASYDGGERVRYRRIDRDGLCEALWLFYYGLRGDAAVDGAYARSIIVDELTFAQQVWAVRPLNSKWVGPLPSNLPEVLDLQTELWMNASYREQVRAIQLIGRLGDQGREELRTQDPKKRDYHRIDLQEVELQRQRGFWTYFVEDLDVFDAARALAYTRLSEQYPRPS
ncbi:hypothetical protein ACU610_03115 [Geodermatophilus sp. URMC 61]|uniref:hypothetical protein n=1 Tax=Geodermatophilus sp. URMC 61 TaxID=3423411 RepID=UPI00406C631E